MTNRTRRPKRRTGKLKVLLFTGSLVATLAGTQLLNIKEAVQAEAAVVENEAISLVEDVTAGTLILMPQNGRSQQIVLKQIPQVVQPQFRPIARSHSSG